MRKNKIVLLLIGIALFSVLSANIKNVDLNKRAVVIGAGVDAIDEGYELTIQIFAFQHLASNSDEAGKAVTAGAKGATLGDAVGILNEKIGKKLSFALCGVLLFGSRLAERGILSAVDYFLRDSDAPGDAAVLYCEALAKDAMKINSPVDTGSMLLLRDMLKDKRAKDFNVKSVKDFGAETAARGNTSVVPVLSKISGGSDERSANDGADGVQEKPNEYYEINRSAVLKNGIHALTLSREETCFLEFIDGSKSKNCFTIEFEDGKRASLEVDRKSCSKKYVLKAPALNARVKTWLKITDCGDHDYGTGDPPYLSNIGGRLSEAERLTTEETIRAGIERVLEKCDAAGLDILRLEEAFYRRFGGRWTAKDMRGHEISKNVVVKVKLDG